MNDFHPAERRDDRALFQITNVRRAFREMAGGHRIATFDLEIDGQSRPAELVFDSSRAIVLDGPAAEHDDVVRCVQSILDRIPCGFSDGSTFSDGSGLA